MIPSNKGYPPSSPHQRCQYNCRQNSSARFISSRNLHTRRGIIDSDRVVSLATSIIVPFARPSSIMREGRGDLGDQICLNDTHRGHFFANPSLAVPLVAVPRPSTSVAITSTHTLCCSAFCRSLKLWHNNVRCERGDLGSGRHPAREIRFERWLVVVTSLCGLAGNFNHNVFTVLWWKELLNALEHTRQAITPFRVSVCLR